MRGFVETDSGFVALAAIATLKRHARNGLLVAYDANDNVLGTMDACVVEDAAGDAVIPNATGIRGAMLMLDTDGTATWASVPLAGWRLSRSGENGDPIAAPIFGDFATGNTQLYVEMPDGTLIDYRWGAADGIYDNREHAVLAFRDTVARRREAMKRQPAGDCAAPGAGSHWRR